MDLLHIATVNPPAEVRGCLEREQARVAQGAPHGKSKRIQTLDVLKRRRQRR